MATAGVRATVVEAEAAEATRAAGTAAARPEGAQETAIAGTTATPMVADVAAGLEMLAMAAETWGKRGGGGKGGGGGNAGNQGNAGGNGNGKTAEMASGRQRERWREEGGSPAVAQETGMATAAATAIPMLGVWAAA